jgi:hypothetical protein
MLQNPFARLVSAALHLRSALLLGVPMRPS